MTVSLLLWEYEGPGFEFKRGQVLLANNVPTHACRVFSSARFHSLTVEPVATVNAVYVLT